MKQFFLSFFIFISMNLMGQTPYANYEMSFFNETNKSLVSFKDSSDYMVFLECHSLDKLSPSGGILMDRVEHLVFTRQIWEAKNKYTEWMKVAKENNVQDFEKPIDVDCYTKAYFYYGGDWHFQFFVKLRFLYKVMDGKHLLIVNTGKLQDEKNEFITHSGFALVFNSTAEVNKFIINISSDKIEEFKTQQNLFKD